ncbi:thiamine-binding protein [Sanguibacter sp. A247]|uniref:thiamine-binding protein n=1 Tax=unclassified Sanguibacter TaxID=2645534 RepID=UPI003FD74A00
MIAEIQVAPRPGGTDAEPYRHVDAAIAVIKASGLTHEVGAMGTTFEGSPDAVWALVRDVHEACLAAGALAVTSHIKVGQAADDAGPQIADLVAKHRP